MQPVIWIADRELGLFLWSRDDFRQIPCALNLPHAPCPSMTQFFCACKKRDMVQRFIYWEGNWKAEGEFPAPPGLECMQSSPEGGWLYLLSGEADSLHTVAAATGELLYGNEAGVYPRSVQVHPTGKLVAVAGGAAGEVLLFQAPSLNLYRRISVPGIACQAAFVEGGLAVLCAVEDGEVQTLLGFIAGNRTIMEEVAMLPGLPGALQPLPDGTVLAGSVGTLAKASLRQKTVVWRSDSFGLPGTLSVRGDEVLVSDPLSGRVMLMNWRKPRDQHLVYEGNEPEAVFQ